MVALSSPELLSAAHACAYRRCARGKAALYFLSAYFALHFGYCRVPDQGGYRHEARAVDILKLVDLGAKTADDGIMKTTVDIPDAVLKEAMGFTKARTKRQAIVTALEDFNHRRRLADLIKHAGTCAGFMSADEVKTLRRKG